MYTHSIILLNKTKIDITKEELSFIQDQIKMKNPLIIVGDNSFPYHQVANIMLKSEADFQEKQELYQKGFFRCRAYGVIHKSGDRCNCKESGEIDPKFISGDTQLKLPEGLKKQLHSGIKEFPKLSKQSGRTAPELL